MDTTIKYCDIFKCVDCPKLGDCCDGDPDEEQEEEDDETDRCR